MKRLMIFRTVTSPHNLAWRLAKCINFWLLDA